MTAANGHPFGLLTLAPFSEIGTGDVYIEHVTANGTLSYSLDVTKCLAANGLTPSAGDEYQLYVRAADQAGDYAETDFRIRLT